VGARAGVAAEPHLQVLGVATGIQPGRGSADRSVMETMSIHELRAELAALEAKAARLSQIRSHLHHQIDFGFETSTSREREREVSDERQELHQQIDSIREQIRARESV
jgi:hypothetical protein